MPKSKHYPPSYIRYQIEHPPVTVHLSRKVKENLDSVKGNRSYAEVITDIMNETFNLEKEIKKLPASEAVISYRRGFKEAKARYAQWGTCNKCGEEWVIWEDGKCDRCHNKGPGPDYSYFRDSETAKVVNEEDFSKAGVKLPSLEKLSYENGKKSGQAKGWEDGYKDGEEDFKITYPCSICGKSIEMKPGGDDHKAMAEYMREHGWQHGSCGK
ncbi:hypothetical protein Thermo_00797 [Thermoplasmatales archaeon]|nr:hypothetical protein Thermo_00797 [Thermoplasmatales archaeon]